MRLLGRTVNPATAEHLRAAVKYRCLARCDRVNRLGELDPSLFALWHDDRSHRDMTRPNLDVTSQWHAAYWGID